MDWSAIVTALRSSMSASDIARAAHLSRHTLYQLQTDPLFEPRWHTCRRIFLIYARHFPERARADLEAELFQSPD
jgi:DNA-binding XRE family transcriptional regulator